MKYRTLKGYKYELMETVSVELLWLGNNCINTPYNDVLGGKLVIKSRYAWDGASGPAIDTRNFMLGSLVHDALYQLIREGHLDQSHRKPADEALRNICRQQGMSKIRAWWVYSAVRTFAKRSSMPRKNQRGRVIEI